MGRERMAKGLCNLTLYEHNCLGHFPRSKLGTFRWPLHRARELLLGRGRHNDSPENRTADMFGEKIFDDGSKELDFEEVTHTHIVQIGC